VEIFVCCESQMWAFSLIPDIKRIFNKPGYPQYKPNTVVPTYSAAMHAKYEVMQQAIEENAFRTKYFCWLDIGLFRDIVSELANAPRFPLYLPKGFRSDSVAYQEVWDPRDPRASVEQIVKNNMVWVCGCFFIAEATVMYRWTREYKVCFAFPYIRHSSLAVVTDEGLTSPSVQLFPVRNAGLH
jgi:hypothetical protein